MQLIGLNWLVIARTGSPTALGLTVLLHTLPKLLLGAWGGVLADKLPARPLIACSQTLHALLAVALALVAWQQSPISLVYGLSALSGTLATLSGPAVDRFASQVVPRDDLGNALALGSTVDASGRIAGMSLAGILIAATSTTAVFMLNAVSFLVVIVTVFAMRGSEMFPIASSSRGSAGVRAGLRYLAGKPTLLLMLALAFVLSSFGRNYQVTMAAMAHGPLGGGAAAYGVLSTVFACGGLLGGLLAAHRRDLTRRLLLGTALATSVLQVFSGFMPGMVAFSTVLLPISAGAVVIDTTMSTRVQLDTADHMRGRAIAAKSMVTGAAGALGGPLLGWLCETIGVRGTLELSGLLTVAATALAAAALAHVARRSPETEREPVTVTEPEPITA